MLTFLFVYGTLKSTYRGHFGREQSDRLRRESRLVGPAVLAGRLYDLGRYPGAVDSAGPGELVHGEVVELLEPSVALQWLDAYEGIIPGNATQSEYHRAPRSVHLLEGGTGQPTREVTAWVYLYARDIGTARPITDGRWTA